MRYPDLTIQPTDTDADGICQSQTPGAAGNLTINGAAATAGVATMGAGQKVTATLAGDESGKTITITGTTADGESQTEALSGTTPGTVTSTKYFKTVTQVAIDAAAAGAITVGFTAVAVSASRIIDTKHNEFNMTIACVLSGTATYTLQISADDTGSNRNAPTYPTTWFDHATIASKSASFLGYQAAPVTAIRLTTASATSGAVTAKVVNSGV